MLPLKRAFLAILFSVIIVSGGTFFALTYYKVFKNLKKNDPNFQITTLLQTCDSCDVLSSAVLAESLKLSLDNPINLYAFETRDAEKMLLSLPVIKNARVRKIKPSAIHIDYEMKEPVAYLGDYNNACIDEDGFIFPFKPFYTSKKLPEIILGIHHESLSGIAWGKKIKSTRYDLALSVLNTLKSLNFNTAFLKCLDVSSAFAISQGKRQIIVCLEERVQKFNQGKSQVVFSSKILRLSPDNYERQLANYKILSDKLKESGEKVKVIDLRLDDLAFIKELN